MGPFLIALNSVLPLFLIILTGWLCTKIKVAHEIWVDVLNKYALWIGFPALIISSLSKLEAISGTFVNLIIYNSIFVIVSILLSYPLSSAFRFSSVRLRTLFLVMGFGNVAYLGIPVLQSIFGNEILPAAAMLSAVYVFCLLTLGLILVEVHGDKNLQIKRLLIRLFKNPLLLSVIVGISLVIFRVEMPFAVDKTISMFAGSVTAVVLFSLGIFLGYQKGGTPKDWLITTVFAAITMIALPAIFWIFLRKSNLPADFIHASIIDAAMPLGLTPYALSQQYRLDTPFAARLVVLATLLSVIVIPLWITVLKV